MYVYVTFTVPLGRLHTNMLARGTLCFLTVFNLLIIPVNGDKSDQCQNVSRLHCLIEHIAIKVDLTFGA